MTGTMRIGAAKIITSTDGTYELDDDGEWAAVLPVYGFVGEPLEVSPDGEIAWGEEHQLVDLVAWFFDHPGRWWFRRGGQTCVLGARELRIASYFADVIRIYETPESWTRCGYRGVCILNWRTVPTDLLEGVGRVRCESTALRDRLVRTLRRREPEITARRVPHGP